MLTLASKVENINTVGKAIAGRLKKMGIGNVRELLWHVPFRYEDFSQTVPIGQLQSDQMVTIRGQLELLSARRARHRRLSITEGLVTDDSGSLKVVWFNQPYLTKMLKPGDSIILSGKVSGDLLGRQMTNPSFEKDKADTTHTARLIPVYSATEGLTQKQLRYLIKTCLPLAANIKEWLPEEIKQEFKLIDLALAVEQIHYPDNQTALEKSKNRLEFDEIFLLQLQQQLIRQTLKRVSAPPIKFQEEAIKQFVADLPFTLTKDQKISTWEILKDCALSSPMNRLLNGDVGSGKTVVATIAAYNAALGGYQAVLMAPTAILAKQHLQSINKILPASDLCYALLTQAEASLYDGENIVVVKKSELLKKLASGEIKFVIGTHALLQQQVKFANLGLAIIDEQHRFGVDQRKTLRAKSGDTETMPHFLSMTATPIPRTLALAMYGDLDLSLIKMMPAGRRTVITRLVDESKRTAAYEFINKQLTAGRQAFVICPLIDASDKLGVKSVTEEFDRLDKEIFPHLPVAILHGKMKAAEKDKVMQEFKDDKIKVLVSTSVVEVGVDIPNASIMIIEGADRFGLSQLHQFRGRVGRGEHQSYCLLFTDSHSPQTSKRLRVMTEVNDGFALAEADLKYRGGGDIYGTAQSGRLNQLRANLLTNVNLIKKARTAAVNILTADPTLEHYPKLRERMEEYDTSGHME
ncbi:MAG: ATP-dependent DNA helicase RecG [Candidatus Komeilibacteria bacterium]|nr:ATP-dependent DNA helicase RecG [Candidatus Komeilibacteria bacterium]